MKRWWSGGPEPAAKATPEAEASSSESTRQVRQALLRLSRRQRELLHLVFYQELTIEQASRALGIPVGTAAKHYERGKARMRILLAEERP